MDATPQVDTQDVRPLDALVIALGLSILLLCSWPATDGAAPRSAVAWALLPGLGTMP